MPCVFRKGSTFAGSKQFFCLLPLYQRKLLCHSAFAVEVTHILHIIPVSVRETFIDNPAVRVLFNISGSESRRIIAVNGFNTGNQSDGIVYAVSVRVALRHLDDNVGKLLHRSRHFQSLLIQPVLANHNGGIQVASGSRNHIVSSLDFAQRPGIQIGIVFQIRVFAEIPQQIRQIIKRSCLHGFLETWYGSVLYLHQIRQLAGGQYQLHLLCIGVARNPVHRVIHIELFLHHLPKFAVLFRRQIIQVGHSGNYQLLLRLLNLFRFLRIFLCTAFISSIRCLRRRLGIRFLRFPIAGTTAAGKHH